jgi:NAD(P)-dependent dehydrogenase (short-subunit alcohol dehydrogenase family)
MQIEGAVAVVTGGASGLGEATIRRLVACGAKAVILDRDEAKGHALAKELGVDRVAFHKTDVSSENDVQAAIDKATSMGTLRIAVSCAGIGDSKRTLNRDGSAHDLESYKRIINVNLVGTFNVLRLAASAIAKAPALEHEERGVIVNTASVAAFEGQIGQAAYASSKAGVVGLTIVAARDLSSVGIRVCTIAPGTFDTPMLSLLPDNLRASLAAGTPFPKRLGNPQDYAMLVEQIVRNGYLNGETIRLDGALRMGPK